MTNEIETTKLHKQNQAHSYDSHGFVIPLLKNQIDDYRHPPDDAPQTLSVVAPGMLSKLLFQSVFALLAWPLLFPFEMIAQDVLRRRQVRSG